MNGASWSMVHFRYCVYCVCSAFKIMSGAWSEAVLLIILFYSRKRKLRRNDIEGRKRSVTRNEAKLRHQIRNQMKRAQVSGKWFASLNKTGIRSLTVSEILHRKMNELYSIPSQRTFCPRSHVFLLKRNVYKGELFSWLCYYVIIL